jgi:hypothetical protein
MRQKQGKCKNCGVVMATTSDEVTDHEMQRMGCQGCLLLIFTLGLAFPFIVLAHAKRDKEAKTFRCTKCGAIVK